MIQMNFFDFEIFRFDFRYAHELNDGIIRRLEFFSALSVRSLGGKMRQAKYQWILHIEKVETNVRRVKDGQKIFSKLCLLIV